MPQELVPVYEVESGKPAFMHSIDAAEAVRLGDYSYMPPGGKPPSEQEMSAAMSRMRGMSVNAHPELQSPEERDATRKAANEAAARAATSTVVVMPGPMAAPVEEPSPRAATHAPVRHAAASGDEKK